MNFEKLHTFIARTWEAEVMPALLACMKIPCGPQSNGHGPNEFLHLPTVKRLTAALARLLNDSQ